MSRQVGSDVRVAIVPDGKEDSVLIGRRNRVGVLTVFVPHRLSAHLYAHVATSDAERHEVSVDGCIFLRHQHLLIAPLVGFVLRRIGFRGVSEPEVRGRRWEAAQMGIDDGIAAIAFELETDEASDTLTALGRLYLYAIPRVGGELHLGNNLDVRVPAFRASLRETAVKQHLVCLAVLDADVERDVAGHLWLQESSCRDGVAGDAEAIDELDAVVALECRVAFRLADTGIAPLYLTIVAVAVDDIGSIQLPGSEHHQQER